jgi:outer membrane protein assembly factor BamB
MRLPVFLICLLFGVLFAPALATETENYNLRVLPAPATVAIDGKATEWDLSGGVFACGDVENTRTSVAVWCHAMHDAKNLYLLVRWKDETPLSNPGSIAGSHGFASDCLQFRTITGYETPNERVSHFTCWRDRDGKDVVDITYGRTFKDGSIRDAQAQGGQQEFSVAPDGKGYLQELAIPWAHITKDGATLATGQEFIITLEPNFGIGVGGRLTIKDLFRAGVTPDRVFTFRAYKHWGVARLEATGKVTPAVVRLADAREFPVAMDKGEPVIDWTGLIKSSEPEGFKTIDFTMPEDGYISLNIVANDGAVVRQLLNCAFQSKGKHSVRWDGLTTPYWRTPGKAVAAGTYTVKAIYHTGIGVRLRGWAGNAGSAPWDNGPKTNWGGDHGSPQACATDGQKVYLGWNGSEAGKALVACDLDGNVQWRHIHGGMNGAAPLAVGDGIVYVATWSNSIYRVDTKSGIYSAWEGRESAEIQPKSMIAEANTELGKFSSLEVCGGKLYLGYKEQNLLAILDAKTGKYLGKVDVPAPIDLERAGEMLFVLSADGSVQSLTPATGKLTPVLTGIANARGLALDAAGKLYVSVGGELQQVLLFTADGKPAGAIGRKGGRALLGAWTPDGMYVPSGLAVDPKGRLWVMEQDEYPKRVSQWETATGTLVKEFFGPTHYGASGASINPRDPNLVVSEGCEWRIDPATGRDRCVGVIERGIASSARHCIGANGVVYIAFANQQKYVGDTWIKLYERKGEGQYALRGAIFKDNKAKTTKFWADANGDGQEQPEEQALMPQALGFTGYYAWSMSLNGDLTLHAGGKDGGLEVKVTGFTACNGPKYDIANAKRLPGISAALGSPDNRRVLSYGNWLTCFDTATGQQLWTYPNTFSGVHGSHAAPPPQAGLIRGSFGIVGSAAYPKPLGAVWALNTNVGEWHLLTEDGFYLSKLFESDPLKFKWPDKAVPGVSLDTCPAGMGGEDFGGSVTQGVDGKLYVQSGKVGAWVSEVVGLESVKALPTSTVTISEPDIVQAGVFREKYLQESTGTRLLAVVKLTPAFTGDLNKDFKGATLLSFKKQDDAAVRATATWDADRLYLAWEVKDKTPWVNGADAPEFLYARGDTVDFQLGTDATAKKERNDAVAGDLRLSIGNLRGVPTAVLYRKISAVKKPKSFSSGVIREYTMDYVDVIPDAQIKVTPRKESYTVEAAIPLASLGLVPTDGLTLRGDLGATHGDPGGTDTALRTYWNNQSTGIVNDEVFELKMEPKNWGSLQFK